MRRMIYLMAVPFFLGAALSAQEADRFEPDSMLAPIAITPGEWIPRNFHDSADKDWFSIRPSANQSLILETSGSLDTYLTLYEIFSGQVQTDDDSGDGYNARIEYELEAGKTYLVEVRALSGATGVYRFRASLESSTAWEEPNNSREQATAIALNQQVTARIQNGSDRDWYRVTVPAGGGRLVAYTDGSLDTLMGVYDAQGNAIAQDDDSGSGNNALCVATVSAGTVYIEVHGYGSATGRYDLTVRMEEAPKPDQYENDDTAPRAKEITPGTPQERSFTDNNDVDWVRFTVRQRGTYAIRAVGMNRSLDTYLELYSVEQDLIAEDDDSGDSLDAYIRYYLEPGTYLIKVRVLGGSSDILLTDNRYNLSVNRE